MFNKKKTTYIMVRRYLPISLVYLRRKTLGGEIYRAITQASPAPPGMNGPAWRLRREREHVGAHLMRCIREYRRNAVHEETDEAALCRDDEQANMA
jgi:hypothetical protein